jgi:hypothetical protein
MVAPLPQKAYSVLANTVAGVDCAVKSMHGGSTALERIIHNAADWKFKTAIRN